MIISLFGDRTIRVSDGQGKHIGQLMDTKPYPTFINLNGSRIKFSEITGIWSDDQWEDMQREKRGEWKCKEGHWHQQSEKYCNIGTTPDEQPDFSAFRQEPEPLRPDSTVADRWFRIIRLNWKVFKETGHYGVLRTLEDLEEYELEAVK